MLHNSQKLQVVSITYSDPHHGSELRTAVKRCGTLICVVREQVWRMPQSIQQVFNQVVFGACGNIVGAMEGLTTLRGQSHVYRQSTDAQRHSYLR